MNAKRYVFICGLHRSGTSLVHEILRMHPRVSGFINTGVPQDEGQHLQSVYPTAKALGGPGRFGFNKASHMDENHPLATAESAGKLFGQWSRHWDLTRDVLLEKSPPNIVRSRFLQRLFPDSFFIVILRHPVAVAYATRKWSKTPVNSLIDHSLKCYERFRDDLPFLKNVKVLRYEDFVIDPSKAVHEMCEFIEVEPVPLQAVVHADVNKKYFSLWEADRFSLLSKILSGIAINVKSFEARANRFGYSLRDVWNIAPMDRIGAN